MPTCLFDIAAGIAVGDISGSPLALFLLSDELLRDLEKTPQLALEALTKAKFTISATDETRAKLQLQFGKKIWRLPRFDSEQNEPDPKQSSKVSSQTITWI